MESGAKAIGYLRVSTDEQATSGLGLEAQREAITAEVKRREWLLLGLIADAGESGGALDRPGLREVLERIADGSASVLVVAKLDRLSRSVIDSARILEWIAEANANLVALDLGVDTSKPAGQLVANVMSAVAQWERATISERTRAALAAKRAKGEAISRPTVPPKVRRRIDRQRQRGWTLQRIADKLNTDEIPTARGGSEWRPSSVSSALGYRQRGRRQRTELPDLRRQVRAT